MNPSLDKETEGGEYSEAIENVDAYYLRQMCNAVRMSRRHRLGCYRNAE